MAEAAAAFAAFKKQLELMQSQPGDEPVVVRAGRGDLARLGLQPD